VHTQAKGRLVVDNDRQFHNQVRGRLAVSRDHAAQEVGLGGASLPQPRAVPDSPVRDGV